LINVGVSLVNNNIISTSADGCILIWKIPSEIPSLSSRIGNDISDEMQPNKDKLENSVISPTVFKYDETGLPSWARTDNELISPELPIMQGKWADVNIFNPESQQRRNTVIFRIRGTSGSQTRETKKILFRNSNTKRIFTFQKRNSSLP
jgi:hypothetical protein